MALQRGDPAALACTWAARNGLRRVLLVTAPDQEVARSALAHALEDVGVAAFLFDAPGGATVAAVGEGVGAYHFDTCDGVLVLGAADTVDLAKVVAMMAGQRHPIPDLAADPARIAARAAAPLLALATSVDGIAACGGSALLLDDGGTPLLLRDAALRPGAAAYCPGDLGSAEPAAMVAALLLDAASAGPDDVNEISRIVDVLVNGADAEATVAAALQAAGVLERRLGPARVLAVVAEVVAGLPRAAAMAALLAPACAGAPELTAMAGKVAATLADDAASGRAVIERMALDGLTLARPDTLPVDLSALLAAFGRTIPSQRRRAHRRQDGRAAMRRAGGSARETGMIRDADPRDFASLVPLNDAAVPAVNALTVADFEAFASSADLFRVCGPLAAPLALLIALGPGRRYDSPNYRWFEAHYDRFLYVDRVVVGDAHRGSGLGSALYADFEAAARRLGAVRLACEVNLRPANPGSLRFHERLGFRPVATQEVEGKLVQLMVRELEG